jgi:tetratricopeptide (TPR) repeat protein
VLSKLKRRDEALESGRRAAELDPESARTWTHWALITVRHGRWEEAIQACDHALALQPQDAEALFCRSVALLFSKHFREAGCSLKAFLNAAGNRPPAEELQERWPVLRQSPKKTGA